MICQEQLQEIENFWFGEKGAALPDLHLQLIDGPQVFSENKSNTRKKITDFNIFHCKVKVLKKK